MQIAMQMPYLSYGKEPASVRPYVRPSVTPCRPILSKRRKIWFLNLHCWANVLKLSIHAGTKTRFRQFLCN